jgi:feruloyl esterase
MDDFYRLFLMPGLNHCSEGPGAWAVGQAGVVSNAVNDSAHNVILGLVEWVEEGRAPDVIVGTTRWENVTSGATQEQRVHCRYPQRSVFNGTVFVCEH